jgi:hypothetical protein
VTQDYFQKGSYTPVQLKENGVKTGEVPEQFEASTYW